jgi:hypothetical protein
MPTVQDFQELIDECIWEWTTQDNSAGYKVTGPNGNSIFLPAAGVQDGYHPGYQNELGYYQSSTPDGLDNAYILHFDRNRQCVGCYTRYQGLSIRPVLKD